ncbi:hypothetical protein MA16_Dca014550 [Dendrobium catenatum]|uniref:Uncharacterized protein n=1 Tax=Dendrobium catenatum TaxID=906689 RepID=A0A2I0XJL5_9ASPA|nr:hypothetical protein MA16_Dca014550 [Dendrobium catenatum]
MMEEGRLPSTAAAMVGSESTGIKVPEGSNRLHGYINNLNFESVVKNSGKPLVIRENIDNGLKKKTYEMLCDEHQPLVTATMKNPVKADNSEVKVSMLPSFNTPFSSFLSNKFDLLTNEEGVKENGDVIKPLVDNSSKHNESMHVDESKSVAEKGYSIRNEKMIGVEKERDIGSNGEIMKCKLAKELRALGPIKNKPRGRVLEGDRTLIGDSFKVSQHIAIEFGLTLQPSYVGLNERELVEGWRQKAADYLRQGPLVVKDGVEEAPRKAIYMEGKGKSIASEENYSKTPKADPVLCVEQVSFPQDRSLVVEHALYGTTLAFDLRISGGACPSWHHPNSYSLVVEYALYGITLAFDLRISGGACPSWHHPNSYSLVVEYALCGTILAFDLRIRGGACPSWHHPNSYSLVVEYALCGTILAYKIKFRGVEPEDVPKYVEEGGDLPSPPPALGPTLVPTITLVHQSDHYTTMVEGFSNLDM